MTVIRKCILTQALACMALVMPCSPVTAQTFPDRPVRLSVGFAPGGIADMVARAVAQGLAPHLGGTVVVENRPGADGRIALQQLITAAPDGYSLTLADSGLAVNAVAYKKTYDPVKDFTPILYIGEVPNYIAVSPKVEAKTLSEFIAYAKANPGKMNYAATASSTLLAAELFKATAGVDLVRVSYKGQAQGMPALMAGDVHLMVSAVGPLTPLVKDGRIKGLAVTGAQRSFLNPDVPTAAEAGLPGMVYINWYVVLGPPGMPRPIVDRLADDLRKAIAEKPVAEQLRRQGIEINPRSAEAFAPMLTAELAKMQRIVDAAKLRID